MTILPSNSCSFFTSSFLRILFHFNWWIISKHNIFLGDLTSKKCICAGVFPNLTKISKHYSASYLIVQVISAAAKIFTIITQIYFNLDILKTCDSPGYLLSSQAHELRCMSNFGFNWMFHFLSLCLLSLKCTLDANCNSGFFSRYFLLLGNFLFCSSCTTKWVKATFVSCVGL